MKKNMKQLTLALGAMAIMSMASAADRSVEAVQTTAKTPVQLTAVQMDQVVAGDYLTGTGLGVETAVQNPNSQAYNAIYGVMNSWSKSGKCTALGTFTASGTTICMPE